MERVGREDHNPFDALCIDRFFHTGAGFGVRRFPEFHDVFHSFRIGIVDRRDLYAAGRVVQEIVRHVFTALAAADDRRPDDFLLRHRNFAP